MDIMYMFYHPGLDSEEIIMSEEESRHCVSVLRMKAGDVLNIIDGKGHSANAVILDANKNACRLKVGTISSHLQTRPYQLHLAISPVKNSERIDWFLEKAAECGIDEISFIESRHAERVKVNMERCQRVLISAIKQSRQFYLPVLHPIQPLSDWLKRPTGNSEMKFMAWCKADAGNLLKNKLHKKEIKRICICIGPEGDFDETEVKMATDAGFELLSLGDAILRTETAALYCCMALKALYS